MKEIFVTYRAALAIITACVAFLTTFGFLWGTVILALAAIPASVVAVQTFTRRAPFETTDTEDVFFRYALPPDAPHIARLDCKHFAEVDLVSAEVFRAWITKNPGTFTLMFCRQELAGYFSVLPLKKRCLSQLLAGEIQEKDIKSEDICVKKWGRRCKNLYFFCVVVDTKYRLRYTRTLFEAIAAEIERYTNAGHLRKIYTRPATNAGKTMVNRREFELVKNNTDRENNFDFYVLRLSTVKDVRNFFAPPMKDMT